MRKLIVVTMAILSVLTFSVNAFAGSKDFPPHTKEGDTCTFSTFVVSDLSEGTKDTFDKCLSGDGVVVSGTTADGKIGMSFCVLHDDVPKDLVLCNSGYDSNPLRLKTKKGYLGFEIVRFVYDGKQWVEDKASPVDMYQFSFLHRITYSCADESFVGYDKLGGFSSFKFVTDDDSTKQEDKGGILGWLKSFWDKLLKLFVRLFVPDESYFKDWFNEIKTAWNAKLKNLYSLKELLNGFFNRLTNTSKVSLNLDIRANQMYEGSPAVSADLLQSGLPLLDFMRPILTGFIAIMTAIACYRKLVVLFDS